MCQRLSGHIHREARSPRSELKKPLGSSFHETDTVLLHFTG